MNNYIIGLNVPLSENGKLTSNGNGVLFLNSIPIMGIAEERISRKKYDGHFKGILTKFLDYIIAHQGKLDTIAITSFAQPSVDNELAATTIRNLVSEFLPNNIKPNFYYLDSHHEAHALAAVSQAGADSALVVVIDHTGSIIGAKNSSDFAQTPLEQTSYYLWKNNKLKLLDRDHDQPTEVGFGRLFSIVTRYIGFASYHEAGKTMGLSSYGDPLAFEKCSLSKTKTNGHLYFEMKRNLDAEGDLRDLAHWFKQNGYHLPTKRISSEMIRRFDMDLAAWLQHQVQLALLKRIRHFLSLYNLKTVSLVGGVALNSVLNSCLANALPSINIYIPPSPSDSGISLGAALKYIQERDGLLPSLPAQIYFGPTYEEDDFLKAIDLASNKNVVIKKNIDPIQEAVTLLSNNKIIGWFQDRSEFGPRALGNRSILASPHNHWTKEILNHQVKCREWFRPYAPSLREEDLDEIFEEKHKSPYMMKVAKIKKEKISSLPSCVHYDGTARLHTVNKNDNPKFYKLIDTFYDLTGIPAILNTSFNLAGMPIVESPYDAVDCFLKAQGMSAVIIDNYLIKKREDYQ